MEGRTAPATLRQRIDRDGFAAIDARSMDALSGYPQGWTQFAQSWDALPLDRYMGDGGVYRRRRFGVVHLRAGTVEGQPHQPHFQRREHNALNGGIERWYEELAPSIESHPVLHGMLHGVARIIDPAPVWHIEIHQFRIEATREQAGLPTPEGIHRDGVDWVLISLIDRCNVTGGVSEIRRPDGKTLASFALAQPLDSMLLDDRRVLHGVSPVLAGDGGAAGRRDTLVVTFRALS